MAVLLIIALVTILVVAGSMLSQVERRVGSTISKSELAKQNAVLALQVAVGQLQAAAGPDQRVTARADIITSASSQPYWTGVWKTGTSGLDVVNSGTPQRQTSFGALTPTDAQKSSSATWLVSGTTDPLTFSTAGNTIALAKYLGASASTVSVPLVLLTGTQGFTSGTTGAYAYWVSDEGVKARLDLSDPTLAVSAFSDPSRSQLHLLGPQANDGRKGFSVLNGTDIRADANLPKVTTLQSLGILSGVTGFSGTSAAQFFPDATIVSRGVLSDVRRGGLKKDLTAALETSGTAFYDFASTYGYGASMLYRSASSQGLVVPVPANPSVPPYYDTVDSTNNPPLDGLSWYSLFFHYNAYKATMPVPGSSSQVGSGGVAPTGVGDVSALPQVTPQRVYNTLQSGSAVGVGFLTPIPIAYRVDLALSSYQDASSQWRLRLHYFPQLALWNPYSVRLSLSGYQFQRDIAAFAGAGSYAASSITSMRVITTSSGSTVTGTYFLVNQTANGRLTMKTKVPDCDSLEPGETRVFALDQNANFSSPQAAINFSALVSNSGMSADYSQQCDVLTVTSSNGFSSGPAFTTSDPNTTVSVDLLAPKLRCQNADTFILPSNRKWPVNSSSRYLLGGAWDLASSGTTWPASPVPTIQQMNGTPRRIIGFYIRQKGLLPSSSSYTYSNAANIIPPFMGNYAALSPVDDNFSFVWQEVYLSPLGNLYQNGATDVNILPSGNFWQTSYGDQSAGAGSPSIRCMLRDVPNQPMTSLGQFMHMSAMNIFSTGDFQSMSFGSMFVGGSCASPGIPTGYNALGMIVGTSSGTPPPPNRRIFLDDSFLSNEALFDRFFLSTVPPQTLNASGTTYPATWTAFNATNSGTSLADSSKPLLNARMKPYYRGGTAPLMADLRNVDRAAANLLIDGAFNVNSTSIPAWKAFLGGLSGNDIRLWSATQQSAQTVTSGSGTPISRFWSGSGQTGANQIWSGLRVLSDTELNELATRIVQQVKLRGPFLSLADFLNRRLGPNTDPLSRCGALQAAIDTTSPDINNTPSYSIKASGAAVTATAPTENPQYRRAPDLIAGNMRDANGAAWNSALGAPGYLMQQDLVQALAPSLTVRSDTFIIRTYGEVRNPKSGEIEGRAWAEAVVQRTPDLVDPSDAPETALSAMNSTNLTLGRRFKIVSFRWLNENDI